MLGSASGKERFQAASTLLDYGFAHYESAAAALPGDAPQTLPVEHGTAATVPLNYESPGHCLMPKGEGGTLEAVVELPVSLSAGNRWATLRYCIRARKCAAIPSQQHRTLMR